MPASVPRSTTYAFKCRMHIPLTRLDFNPVLGSNEVLQYFHAAHEGVHHVCLRLRTAIPRTRFASALTQLESDPTTNFERLDASQQWQHCVYMGSEGEGKEIRDTIRQHWMDRDPTFHQSLSPAHNHTTNMIRGAYRTRVVPPPSRSASTASVVSDMAETLPITDSPPRSPIASRSDSGHTAVFTIRQDGQPMHPMERDLNLRDMVVSAIGETLHIDRDYNLPARHGEILSQIGQLTNTVNTFGALLQQLIRRR
jgi:hypothetical protein